MLTLRTPNGQICFGITEIPGRKNKCLYTSSEKGIQILAYFKSKAEADEFQRVMDFIYNAVTIYQFKEHDED